MYGVGSLDKGYPWRGGNEENDRDPGGRGDCSALGSVFESWLLERGHVVGCTFVICTSMFCFKQNLARY